MTETPSPDTGQRFALLYQLSQTFNSSLDLAEVLDRVMDEVIQAVNAERGFIALRNEDGELEFRSARGIEQTTIDNPEFQISRSVVEEVSKNGKGVRVTDAQQDDRFHTRRSVLDLKLRAILCSPLILKDQILGVIYVDNRVVAGIFSEDQLELLNAIGSSAATAIENARLYQVAVEKGRIERELQMAFKVQSSLIPEELPQSDGWEFAACWHPARQVSGDFYDSLQDKDGLLNFIIADVTDKGMPAALFMALTRSLVRANIDQAATLAEAISAANRLICTDSTMSMPVTLFACALDPDSGQLTYVNAGHNPPIYFSASKGMFADLTRTGMFMGFEEEAEYQQQTIDLAAGDFMVCFTDGVLDAINEEEKAYEMDRLQAVINENLDASAEDLKAAIERSVHDFSGDTEPYDDLTVLIIKRT